MKEGGRIGSRRWWDDTNENNENDFESVVVKSRKYSSLGQLPTANCQADYLFGPDTSQRPAVNSTAISHAVPILYSDIEQVELCNVVINVREL